MIASRLLKHFHIESGLFSEYTETILANVPRRRNLMKTTIFTRGISVALFLLAIGLFMAMPSPAEAKATTNKLEVNKTYTQYDVTGDKKADTLLVSAPWNKDAQMYGKYEVFINGKKALSASSNFSYQIDIRRLKLNNGKIYLSIAAFIDNSDIPGAAIYQYKNGKLKKAIDLNSMKKIGYHNSVTGISASGNKIGVTYQEMSYSLGFIAFQLDYQYKNGKMVQKTTKPKLLDTAPNAPKGSYWTANRSMNVLKTPGGKKLTTLKPGQKVTIDRIYINAKHSKIYLHVKIRGGKSGWVKGLTSYPGEGNALFKEVVYAG